MKPTPRSAMHKRALRRALPAPRRDTFPAARNGMHEDALRWSLRVAEMSEAVFPKFDALRAQHHRATRPPGGATANHHQRLPGADR